MNKEQTIQRVSEQINLDNIKFLVWYGNRVESDVSLLAVSEKESGVHLCELLNFNILTIGKDELMRRLGLFDPLVTEPVINGYLIWGDDERWGLLRSDAVLSFSFSDKVIRFLREEACEKLRDAATSLQIYKQKKDKSSLLSFLIALSFACSYFEFAKYYSSNPKFLPITLKHLLVEDGTLVLKEVLEFLRAVKSAKEFNKNQAVDLFRKTQKLLEVI